MIEAEDIGMSQKFGNYLFRNLKGQETSSDPSIETQSNAHLLPLEDRIIELRRDDFLESPNRSLDWTLIPEGKIQVRLKETHGIMEGRVAIRAEVLRKISPDFVDKAIPDEAEFAVSLKTVVLQIQSFLQKPESETAKRAGPDFDTPIAQVAREDEGFFKLEKASGREAIRVETKPDEAGSNAGEETPVKSPFPLIREKPLSSGSNEQEASGQIRPVPVTIPSASAQKGQTSPFSDLPKVGSNPPLKLSRRRLANQESASSAKPPGADPKTKPPRRQGLEKLQEVFMTDDFLDAGQVAKLLAGFPKVKGAVILLEDGTLMGGELPPGLDLDAALAAPGVLRAIREFGLALLNSEPAGFTILSDLQISIFMEGRVCVLIAHEGRALLPGMRDRMIEIAKALDAMYEESEEN